MELASTVKMIFNALVVFQRVFFSLYLLGRENARIEPGPWEVVLMTYNNLESEAAEPMIVRAREKGAGFIAMKVLAGGMRGRLKPLINDRLGCAAPSVANR